jgi:dipeptidyl aminopeptidase/acylaminoacyl peptidase
MKTLFTTLIILISVAGYAQKKTLDHADFDIWNTIKNRSISPDGSFIMYSLEKGETDNHLKIKDSRANLVFDHERSERGQFTYDSDFALFTIKAWQDSVKEMKRRKVKKKDLPKDSLGIYNIKAKTFTAIANVKSYKLPEKWSGFVAYQLTEIKPAKEESKKEETGGEEKLKEKKTRKKGAKKVGKDNGYHLIVRNLQTAKQDTIKYVTSYLFAKEGKMMAYVTTGIDSIIEAGVYLLNLENNGVTNILAAEKGKYSKLAFSDTGKNFGFVADLDTTKVLVRPNELYYWQEGMTSADKLVDAASAPEGYRVSRDGTISFSKDESKMFFGLAIPPIVKDTTLLDEEIVNVEVWTYNEPRLYTVQELQIERDKKRSYAAVIHLKDKKLVQLATVEYPNSTLGDEGNAEYALVSTSLPYQLAGQWQGGAASDYAVVNTNTGEITRALTGIRGRMSLSPAAKYVYGYDMVDSTWLTYAIAAKKITKLTKGKVFYNEIHDTPSHPRSYGAAGWTENDAAIILNDRYDLWQFNPENADGKLLTNGRKNTTTYRYVRLDDEERFIDAKAKWLLTTFNETDKNSGYYELNNKNGKGKQLLIGPYAYSYPKKSKESAKLIFTRQSFEEFPDIRYSDLSFKTETKISHANPQQSEYNWGTAEIVKWTSLDGVELEGMLIKPENFDPNKKYPMIVNFYEKSSNGLFRHRTPIAGRSTINYSFYTSRGYLIFNPNVNYRIGYPGESAYNCVIPGVTSLIDQGFVDKDNIGVQGHSWGGYQIAYLVTKTDIFKAAEAGAPVPNMISAYGGIRWWTGLSRQFQYEHTQSRIGGTPWEYPSRFIENSPIFFIDKINTPLLIMHNDADGHVPWYQGIEFFVSLRRLGKPSWFLNYNGEPHWPLKHQNRKDFNIRMAQFFDYYLKGEAMPVWMDRGVPAIEKGINQGLELIDK